jgi:hypothetical protein
MTAHSFIIVMSWQGCSKVFSTTGTLIDHELDHQLRSDAFVCPKCRGQFKYFGVLLRHLQTQHLPPPPPIPAIAVVEAEVVTVAECLSEEEEEVVYEATVMEEHTASSFQCPQCRKQYRHHWQLRCHFERSHVVKVSLKDNRLACPVPGCEKHYRYKGDLKYHLNHKHPTRIAETLKELPSKSDKTNKAFCCPIETCPSGFRHLRDLQRHLHGKHPEAEKKTTSQPPIEDDEATIAYENEEEEEARRQCGQCCQWIAMSKWYSHRKVCGPRRRLIASTKPLLADGKEEFVKAILGHKIVDDGVSDGPRCFLDTLWENGTRNWQPIENFYDTNPRTGRRTHVNEALSIYACRQGRKLHDWLVTRPRPCPQCRVLFPFGSRAWKQHVAQCLIIHVPSPPAVFGTK